jgi:hypothetical protein
LYSNIINQTETRGENEENGENEKQKAKSKSQQSATSFKRANFEEIKGYHIDESPIVCDGLKNN